MEFTAATVGDSHSSSQLIAAKRTFQGSVTYDIAGAKIQLFFENQTLFQEKVRIFAPDLVISLWFTGGERESGEKPEQCPLL